MPELESEESAEEGRNQQGEGLKTLTPNQMLSRLPISLAQLKAGNNSKNLKNEIRQLLYSLYKSKNLTKHVSVYVDQMELCVIINNIGMKINVGVNVKKELVEKGVCDKGFIWNPTNCKYECDKSCDIGEYLDYKN